MTITQQSLGPEYGPNTQDLGLGKKTSYLLPLASRKLNSSAGTGCGQGWAQMPKGPGEGGNPVRGAVLLSVFYYFIVLTYIFHLH